MHLSHVQVFSSAINEWKMSAFLRVKLIEYLASSEDGRESSTAPQDTYVDVRIKETEETANGRRELVQKRRTLHQEWHSFFDSHLYSGRVLVMLVMQRSTNSSLAEVGIGVDILTAKYEDDWTRVVLDMKPGGHLVTEIRYFDNVPLHSVKSLAPKPLPPVPTDIAPYQQEEAGPSVVDDDSMVVVDADDADEDEEVYGIANRHYAMKQPKIYEAKGD